MTAGIPDPGGSGVVAVLAAADAAATFTQRYLLGDRDGAVVEAADAALDVDDWATDTWWLNQPAGESS